MFTFNLKKEWFEKIKNRQKTIEYRECKDYWFKRFRKIIEKDLDTQYTNISEIMPYTFRNPVYCIFRLGYTKTYLIGKITKIDIIDGMESDLKCKGSVFAIYFELEDEFDIDKAIDAMVYKYIFDKMNRLTAGKRIDKYDELGNTRITEIINGQIVNQLVKERNMEDFEFVFEYKDNSDDVNEQITQYANLWLKNNFKTENICNLVAIFGNGVNSLN